MPLSFGSKILQKVLLRPAFGKCKISTGSMKISLWYVHNKQIKVLLLMYWLEGIASYGCLLFLFSFFFLLNRTGSRSPNFTSHCLTSTG